MNEITNEDRLHTADMVEAAERRDQSKEITQVDKMNVAALFDENEAEGFRSRWNIIQTNFVDEPHSAVEEADSLVAEAIKRIAEVFADERAQLEEQWGRGDDVTTEDLRLALQRYRSFFHRLLSV